MAAADEGISLAIGASVLDAIAEQVADRVAQRFVRPAEPWVGVAEVAAHLHCKPQRVYDLVHRRDATGLPHRKEGARLLFRISEIDAWLDRSA